jgi:hypothetical protein
MSQVARGGEASSLPLDDELRKVLGLAAQESLRALHVGHRTVLLERCGGTGSPALPRDRDLVLTADVRAFPPADLLGMLHAARKSGLVLFAYRDHQKWIYLHRGEVIFAASNQRMDRIGECLVRAGVISVEQLREAERRFTPPERFGKVLVERGFLTPRELWNAVKYQAEEIVRSLFSYSSGTVYFWEGEIQPDNVVRLSLPTARLVAEGVQRRDELFRFLAMLEDPRVELIRVESAGAKLAGSERSLFDALAQHASFPEVCRALGSDPLTAARLVQLLRLVGAVRLSRTPHEDGFVDERDLRAHDEEVLRQCVLNHLTLMGELAAPVIALEGPGPLVERFGRVLDEARKRSPAFLADVVVGSHAELDPEQLLQRALRLPGERAPQVCAALGELVAYLEFELRNHPGIPDPEEFLSGLKDLQSRLGSETFV